MSTVLIVDDNQQNLYMLQVLLSANGFQVELASNGAEALERARHAPPDMIISDILMPVMDGFGLCRACKADERLKNIPFVFYTATYTDPRDEDFALSLGADRFIIKPVEPEKFLVLLRGIWNNHEAGKMSATRQPIEETECYKEYNAALIRKLEDKMLQLEETNRILERDIAERKQVEDALRTSEERFRTIFQEAPMGVALIDSLTGHIYEVNPRFAQIAGRTTAEMATIDWMSITHPDDVKGDLDNMALLNAGKIHGFNMNKRYRRPDGSYVWINMTIAPFTVEDTSHPRHLCMIEDITERRRAEAQLAEQFDELRRWHDATLGREGRILDLKREVNQLLAQTGKPPRYPSAETENP